MNLLQNKTVCLRAPEPEDLELLYSWENNPEWWGDWEHVGALFPLSVERIYSRISPGYI